jgi:hypothetical protein
MLFGSYLVTFMCLLVTSSRGGCTSEERKLWTSNPAQGAAFTAKLMRFGKRHGSTIMMLSTFFFPHAITELRHIEPKLSASCADCFVRTVACAARNCYRFCIYDEGSKDCSLCAQSNCNAALAQCVGTKSLPPSPFEIAERARRPPPLEEQVRRASAKTPSPPAGPQPSPSVLPPAIVVDTEPAITSTLTRKDSWPHLPDDYDPFYIRANALPAIPEFHDTPLPPMILTLPVPVFEERVSRRRQAFNLVKNNLRYGYYAGKYTCIYFCYSVLKCFRDRSPWKTRHLE